MLGEELILVVSRSAELAGHTVKIVSNIENAISAWEWSTRISPIFPLGKVENPNFGNAENCRFYFVGPLDQRYFPADISTFLTFGTYNALFIARNIFEISKIEQFLKSRIDTPWEYWDILGDSVVNVQYSEKLKNSKPSSKIHFTRSQSAALRSAQEENVTLLSASIAKAIRYYPQNAEELQLFADVFTKKVADSKIHEINKLSWLVNVNAALSRYTAQTFSGTSPILETECHFWTHSLLGVGLATQALTKIRRFVESAINKHNLIDKLVSLKKIPTQNFFARKDGQYHQTTYLGNIGPSSGADWDKISQIIGRYAKTTPIPKSDEKFLPLIVCFSGRDGFKSTTFSLSAPLEVISCCNTFGWSPMTLTHEICHVWVTGLLGKLFPNLLDPKNVADLERFSKSGVAQGNLFEQIQQYLYYCYTLLHIEYRDSLLQLITNPLTPNSLAPNTLSSIEIIETYNLAINELLTHILDFQFFYGRDEELYINSIWSSWDVIPNIKDRLSDYIIRSAAALLVNNLNEDRACDTTLDHLEALLNKLHLNLSDSQYLEDACELLKNERTMFLSRLKKRAPLVRFAHTFFSDNNLAAELGSIKTTADGMLHAMKEKEFSHENAIGNPLKFISQFSNDKKFDRPEALWMLHHLAFAEFDDATI